MGLAACWQAANPSSSLSVGTKKTSYPINWPWKYVSLTERNVVDDVDDGVSDVENNGMSDVVDARAVLFAEQCFCFQN